jgi:hypothetical protein
MSTPRNTAGLPVLTALSADRIGIVDRDVLRAPQNYHDRRVIDEA